MGQAWRPAARVALAGILFCAGAAVLVVLAYHERQWGFLLLEGVWALVSAYGFVARRRGTPVAPTH